MGVDDSMSSLVSKDHEYLEELVDSCIALASRKRVYYVDVRAEKRYDERLSIADGVLQHQSVGITLGVGVRVLNNQWGFSATTNTSAESLKKSAEFAVEVSLARARKCKGKKVTLGETKSCQDSFKTATGRSIEDVPMEEKVNHLIQWQNCARVSKRIKSVMTDYTGIKTWKAFGNTDETRISSEKDVCWVYSKAFAKDVGGLKSFSEIVGGSDGYDTLVNTAESQLKDVGKKALEIAKASNAKNENSVPVILHPNFAGLLCHEICGHASEADRILGKERARAGTSWWFKNLGEKIGSESVTAVDDPTIKGSLGYYLYDDEGVKAGPKVLVDKGVMKGYLHNRETASIFGVAPNGSATALGYEYFPLVRVSNTFLKSGDWTLDEMIRDTEHGYLLGPGVSPQLDDKRFAWSIGSPYAYEIKKGEISCTIRDIAAFSSTPVFLNSVDAVSKDITIFPLAGCGKGEPKQPLPAGIGGPYLRGRANVMKIG